MKIIQIAVTQGELFALTEDGRVHRLNGGGDDVSIGYTWEVLPPIVEASPLTLLAANEE